MGEEHPFQVEDLEIGIPLEEGETGVEEDEGGAEEGRI